MYGDEESFYELLKDGPKHGQVSDIIKSVESFDKYIAFVLKGKYDDAKISIDITPKSNTMYVFYNNKLSDYKITENFGKKWQEYAIFRESDFMYPVRR